MVSILKRDNKLLANLQLPHLLPQKCPKYVLNLLQLQKSFTLRIFLQWLTGQQSTFGTQGSRSPAQDKHLYSIPYMYALTSDTLP